MSQCAICSQHTCLLLPLARRIAPAHLKRIARNASAHTVSVTTAPRRRLPRLRQLEVSQREGDPPLQVLPLAGPGGVGVVVRLAADGLLWAARHCRDDPAVVAAAAVHVRLLEEALCVLQPALTPLGRWAEAVASRPAP